MDHSVPSLLSWAEERLFASSPTPRLEAEVLLGHASGTSRAELLAASPAPSIRTAERFRRLIDARRRGKPVAYLTHEKEFYGRPFHVDERVLIPRPETELLVELALKQVPSYKEKVTILDLGTGSGNIIISLAAEITNHKLLTYIGTDISREALEVAKRNAMRHGVADRITFLHGSLLEPLLNSSFDIRYSSFVILANLPYVADHWVKDLAPDITYFEPKIGLAGGPTGLELYAKLFGQLRQLIVKSKLLTVRLYVEHDPRQLAALQALIQELFGRSGFSHPDLAGLPRVLEITPP